MSSLKFNAEASLGPARGRYRGQAAYGGSGAVAVLPMLPKRPTVGTARDCIAACEYGNPNTPDCGTEGLIAWCCYSDGCWICNSANLQDCVWDPAYRGPPSKPLGGVFVPIEDRPKPIPPIGTLQASM
jgi:hypothetical protein